MSLRSAGGSKYSFGSSSTLGSTSSASNSSSKKKTEAKKNTPIADTASSKIGTTSKKEKSKTTTKTDKNSDAGKSASSTKAETKKEQAKKTGKSKAKTLTKNGWENAKVTSTSKDGSSTVTATKDGVTYQINYNKNGDKTGKKIVGGEPKAIAEKKGKGLEKQGYSNVNVSDDGTLTAKDSSGNTVSLTYNSNGTKASKSISTPEGRTTAKTFDSEGRKLSNTITEGVPGSADYKVTEAKFNAASGAKLSHSTATGVEGTDGYRKTSATYQIDANGNAILDAKGKPVKDTKQIIKGTPGTNAFEQVDVKYYENTGIKAQQQTIRGNENDVRNYLVSLNNYTTDGILKDSTVKGGMQILGSDQYFESEYFRVFDTTNDKRQVLSESTKVNVGNGLEEILKTEYTYDAEGRVATSKEVRNDNVSLGEDGQLYAESETTTESVFDYSSTDKSVMKTAQVAVAIKNADGTTEHKYIETYIDNKDASGNLGQDSLVDYITREYTSEARYTLKSYTYGDGAVPTEVKILDDTYSDEYATYADAKAAGASPVLTAKTTATLDESTKNDMIGQTYNMNTIVTDGDGNFICEDNGVSMGEAHGWFNKTFDYQTRSAREILDEMMASGASQEEIEAFLNSIGEMDGSSQGARQAEEYYRGVAGGATGAGDAGNTGAVEDTGVVETPTAPSAGDTAPAASSTAPAPSSTAPTTPAASTAPSAPTSNAPSADTPNKDYPSLSDKDVDDWKQKIDDFMKGENSTYNDMAEWDKFKDVMSLVEAYIKEKYEGKLTLTTNVYAFDTGNGFNDLIFTKNTGEVIV